MAEQKKILVIYFTQSGQMRTVSERFVAPFATDREYTVSYEELKPAVAFPFPWSAFTFFNAFPETFYQKPMALQPFSENIKGDYDLIVLAYQPWFLTPPPVMSSFLQTAEAKRLMQGKKIVTLIACRNMWLGAQEKVKQHIIAAGGHLTANIALVDKSPNVVSMITILRWMLWGKKEKFWIFPSAGIADADILQTELYGQMIKESLQSKSLPTLQPALNDKGAVEIVPELVLMETRGQRAFGIWSAFIGGAALGSWGRKLRVYIFMFLLPTAIVVLSPLLALISFLMLRLRREELIKKVNYFKTNALAENDIWRN